MEEGYDKVRAATFAYELTAIPMLTGTLITAAGFLPIGLAKSVTGEYTFAIFAVTVIALLICWVASVYFVPYLGTLLLKVPPHVQAAQANQAAGQGGPTEIHELFDSPFYVTFRRAVTWCVINR
jgi:multidrug efflux pump subunit AcrB